MLQKAEVPFTKSINVKPQGFVSTKSKLEKYLVVKILELFLNSNTNVEICFDESLISSKTSNTKFILCPPRLLHVLKILVDPEFQTGETFINGKWYLHKGDLTEFLAEIFSSPKGLFYYYFKYLKLFTSVPFFIRQFLWTKKATRKSKNHYDEEASIYNQILDEEFLYTCAFFEEPEQSLEHAQVAKMEKIVQRLNLDKGYKKYLDIGSGWGSLLRYAAKRNERISATGISISKGQINHAKILDSCKLTSEQVSRIDYKLEDYLNYTPEHDGFDAISVVGMMEHVGLPHHKVFLKSIERLLKPGGRVLIHSIICPSDFRPNNRWVDKHIFPGGYAPSRNEVMRAAKKTELFLTDHYVHDGNNYKRTMQEWKNRFLKNYEQIGFNISKNSTSSIEIDCELRIWYFYLSSLQNMFDSQLLGYQVEHFIFEKPIK